MKPALLDRIDAAMKSGNLSLARELIFFVMGQTRLFKMPMDMIEWLLDQWADWYLRRGGAVDKGWQPTGGWSEYVRCPAWTGDPTGLEYYYALGSVPSTPLKNSALNCVQTGRPVNQKCTSGDGVATGVEPKTSTQGITRVILTRPVPGLPQPAGLVGWQHAKRPYAPPLPAAPPFRFFRPEEARPGESAVSPYAPPVKDWGRPQSEWPEGRKVGEDAKPVNPVAPKGREVVQEWAFSPSSPPTYRQATDTEFPRKPPPANVKEKKVAITSAGVMKRVYNFATETGDFVDAWWKTIPKDHRSKMWWKFGMKKPGSPRLAQRMKEVYEYWAFLERTGGWKTDEGRKYLSNSMAAVFTNELEDRFFGTIGKISGKAAKAVGRPHGFQLGPVF